MMREEAKEKTAYVLHHPYSLLRLPDKLILFLLHLGSGFLAHHFIIRIHASGPTRLTLGLGRIKTESRALHTTPGPRRKHQVRVQRRTPTGQKPLLDLRILRQAGLPHLF